MYLQELIALPRLNSRRIMFISGPKSLVWLDVFKGASHTLTPKEKITIYCSLIVKERIGNGNEHRA